MSWEELGKTQVKIDPSQNDVQLSGSIVSQGEVDVAGVTYSPIPVGANNDYMEIVGSAIYGSTIRSIAVDDDHVYVGGTGGKIQKRLKSTLALVAESPAYGGEIFTVLQDGNYVYAVGTSTYRVRKYLKEDLSYVEQSDIYGGMILAASQDATYIYIGGYGNQEVWKIDKTDLSKKAEVFNYGATVRALAVGGNYVYVGGAGGVVRKVLTATMVEESYSPAYGGEIRSIVVDDAHVFVGGDTTQRIRQYLVADMSYVQQSDDLGYGVRGLAIADDYVFAGGAAGGSVVPIVRKFRKSDLGIQSQLSRGAVNIANAVDGDLLYSDDYDAGMIYKIVHCLYENLFWGRDA